MEQRDILVLHVVKWYPYPKDIQHGIFVKKHIDATGDKPHILGFLNDHFPRIQLDNSIIFGAKKMTFTAKFSAFISTVNTVNPNIIHFHCFAPDLLPMLWYARLKGIKTVHSEHWSGLLHVNLIKLDPWKKRLARWFFEHIHLVLPVSTVLEEGIRMVAPKAHLKVIPNIVDKHEVIVSNHEERPSISFCMVADVVFNVKRQNIVLEAFKNIAQVKAELHFYGGGPDLELLEVMASRHPNVYVHGRISNDEVLAVLPTHKAHVLFSEYETFGITTIEARKAGIWAISRPIFGASTLKDSCTVMVNTTNELVDSFERILKEKDAFIADYSFLESKTVSNQLFEAYKGLLS